MLGSAFTDIGSVLQNIQTSVNTHMNVGTTISSLHEKSVAFRRRKLCIATIVSCKTSVYSNVVSTWHWIIMSQRQKCMSAAAIYNYRHSGIRMRIHYCRNRGIYGCYRCLKTSLLII